MVAPVVALAETLNEGKGSPGSLHTPKVKSGGKHVNSDNSCRHVNGEEAKVVVGYMIAIALALLAVAGSHKTHVAAIHNDRIAKSNMSIPIANSELLSLSMLSSSLLLSLLSLGSLLLLGVLLGSILGLLVLLKEEVVLLGSLSLLYSILGSSLEYLLSLVLSVLVLMSELKVELKVELVSVL